MPRASNKPIIFISYAHEDVDWLSFVRGHFEPAIKQDAVDIWIDGLLRGGDRWSDEIERKLRECDIFVLLVSRFSTGSDYIVDKEIAIIQERKAKGEDVRIYPLLMTPTTDVGLNIVSDYEQRPSRHRSFSSYSQHDCDDQMSKVVNEIVNIAAEIRRNRPLPTSPPRSIPPWDLEPRFIELGPEQRMALESWLRGQIHRGVAVRLASRAAMRAAPFAVRAEAPKLPALASAIFRAIALARNISKYPARTDEFASAAHGAYAAAYAAADATIVAASGYAAASAYSAVAAAYAVNSAAAAAYAVDTAAGAADGYAGYAARAGAVLWGETHFDLDVTQGFTSGPKEDLPLWSRGTPQWAQEAWANLVAALPKAEDWEVWIEWYEDRLRGGSRGDAYEMAFARAPLDVWNKGPAAAAWIRAHLP